MRDNIFKKLTHSAENYEIIAIGAEISKGYKPDCVLRSGNDYIIMECDTGTTRKGFVGGMIKAAKYLTGEKKGIVIFVLKEKENTTVEQIYAHLKPYFEWIEPLTNLRELFVISTTNYCSAETPIKLLDADFMNHAKRIVRLKNKTF
ncbi:hypothetical protein ACLOAU_04430 [Niabella sp. CJ426]|uniref:hypothetical protein n=1 Tax=Niabella sp. CJ426 TaxID=3393740 RepID=UPI003D0924AC